MMSPKIDVPRHLLCFLTAVTFATVIVTAAQAEAQQQAQFLVDPTIASSLTR